MVAQLSPLSVALPENGILHTVRVDLIQVKGMEVIASNLSRIIRDRAYHT